MSDIDELFFISIVSRLEQSFYKYSGNDNSVLMTTQYGIPYFSDNHWKTPTSDLEPFRNIRFIIYITDKQKIAVAIMSTSNIEYTNLSFDIEPENPTAISTIAETIKNKVLTLVNGKHQHAKKIL